MNAIHTNETLYCGRLTHLFRALLILTLFLPGILWAQEQSDDKAIRIQEQSKGLKVTFQALKDTYKVGEAIRFKVRGNQRFYLYLFSINRLDQTSVLLLPNNKQKDNRYDANQTFTVPSNVEFYADAPGTEEIVMVASIKHLNFDTSRYQKSGDFLLGDAQIVDDQLKALRIRTRAEETREPVIKQLQLTIIGQKVGDASIIPRSGNASDTGGKPIVFVSTDRTNYSLGDDVQVVFGADKPGWVHIYAIEPQGERSLLKRQEIAGDKIYRLAARAERPTGEHALVVVYSDSEQVPEKVITLLDQDASTKGLRLLEEESPVAVYRFRIQE